MANNITLSDKQKEAVALLIETGSPKAAAEAAKVDVRTIHTWRKGEAFKRAMYEAQMEGLKTVALSTIGSVQKAIGVLDRALDHKDVAVRIRAAKELLSQAASMRDALITEERLQSIEQRLEGGA